MLESGDMTIEGEGNDVHETRDLIVQINETRSQDKLRGRDDEVGF